MHYSKEEYDFEPFDLEKAEDGAPVCAEDGYVYEFIKNEGTFTVLVFSQLVYDTRLLEGQKPQKSNGYIEKSKYDLFHPVPKKAVKTKRIEFDASRIGEEGVTIECRIPEDWVFKKILATDLDSESPLAVVVNNRTKDYLVNLRPNGRSSEGDDGDYDLVLVVPDDSPSLPSMQEVAEKIQADCGWYVDSGKISADPATHAYSQHYDDAERLKAIGLLMNVARFVNDGWEPDWSEETTKWFFQLEFMGHLVGYKIDTNFNYQKNLGGVYFKSEEAANYAREILNSWEPGDAILKLALGVKP